MRFLKLREVLFSTGLSRSTIYKYIADDLFPKPVSLGERSVAWVEDEVNDWLIARVHERDEGIDTFSS